MGRCWKCNTELRLTGQQFICDNCNKTMGYACWNCKTPFSVRDAISKKRIPECNSCGDYYCPECKLCKKDCPKIKWAKTILNILSGQYNLDNELLVKNPSEKIKRITELIEDLKKEKKPQKICPNGVYASYAHGARGEQGKIKSLLAKMNGVGVKSKLDAEGYRSHFNKVLGVDEGEEFTVKKLKSDGRYGNEERDACAMGICLGELTAKIVTTKTGKNAIVYKKIPGGIKCEHLREDNFTVARCPKCRIDYNNPKLESYQPSINHCPKCKYLIGEKKGQYYKLKRRDTNTFICNCHYDKFITVSQQEDDQEE